MIEHSGTVYIYSGVPGAGKTRYIQQQHPGADVVSADDFFLVDDEYRFDPTKIGEAHDSCIRRFLSMLDEAMDRHFDVIVDNTNTSVAEIAPYVALANAFKFRVVIRTLVCDPLVAFHRNVHGVTLETCLKLAHQLNQRDANMPLWWPKNEVIDLEGVDFIDYKASTELRDAGVPPSEHRVESIQADLAKRSRDMRAVIKKDHAAKRSRHAPTFMASLRMDPNFAAAYTKDPTAMQETYALIVDIAPIFASYEPLLRNLILEIAQSGFSITDISSLLEVETQLVRLDDERPTTTYGPDGAMWRLLMVDDVDYDDTLRELRRSVKRWLDART